MAERSYLLYVMGGQGREGALSFSAVAVRDEQSLSTFFIVFFLRCWCWCCGSAAGLGHRQSAHCLTFPPVNQQRSGCLSSCAA